MGRPFRAPPCPPRPPRPPRPAPGDGIVREGPLRWRAQPAQIAVSLAAARTRRTGDVSDSEDAPSRTTGAPSRWAPARRDGARSRRAFDRLRFTVLQAASVRTGARGIDAGRDPRGPRFAPRCAVCQSRARYSVLAAV
ncbi:hypothetical protein TRAPUB_3237 [Trametes pubescens]|uniref:Uncharacterized protein n=1 Tax=Trametes pubescens TaxID=154538 RepID=A0A1M2VEB8_TRAPU|nr:hypothetical protein TRAPUB_3237 [Trametes pubescens]